MGDWTVWVCVWEFYWVSRVALLIKLTDLEGLSLRCGSRLMLWACGQWNLSCVQCFFFFLSGKAAVSQTCANHTPKMAVHSFQCSCLSSTYAGPSCTVKAFIFVLLSVELGFLDLWDFLRQYLGWPLGTIYTPPYCQFSIQFLQYIRGTNPVFDWWSANPSFCQFVDLWFREFSFQVSVP